MPLNRGASFIDKTFDVSFEVSEPVSSDWREFLERQLRYVFGTQYQESWGFWTRRIFEQSLPGKSAVTPREINKLANRLGALFLQRFGDGINVELMAVYIIHRSQIELSVLDFIKAAGERYARIAPDWDRQLAALHYGVSGERAAQVLLTEPIRNAIINNLTGEIQELAKIDGFGETFEFITADLPQGDGDQATAFEIVTNAGMAMDALPRTGAMWETAAWQNLINRYLEVGGPYRAREDLGKRISILSQATSADKAGEFVERASENFGAMLAINDMPEKSKSGLREAAVQLISFAKAKDIGVPEFILPGDAQSYVKSLNTVSFTSSLWPQIRTELDAEAISVALVELLRSPSDQWHVAGAVSSLANSSDGAIYGGKQMIAWDTVIEAAQEIVRNPAEHNVSPLPSMRVLVRLAQKVESAGSSLTELVTDGTVTQRMNEAHTDKQWESIYLGMAILVWSAKPFGPPNSISWSQLRAEQPKLEQAILDRLKLYFPGRATEIIWSSYEASSASRDLTGEMIKLMIARSNLGKVDVAGILDKLPHYLAPIPSASRPKFMTLLESASSFWPQLERLPLGPVLHEAAKLLSRIDAAKAVRARSLVTGKIEAASKGDWLTALSTGGEPYGMVTGFLPKGTIRMPKSSELYQALIEGIPTVAGSAQGSTRLRWFTLAGLLRSQAINDLYKSLASHLIDTHNKNTLLVLKAGGAEFVRRAAFAELADGAVKAILLPQLQTTHGREWLKDNQQEAKSWIRRSSKGSQEGIKLALRKLHESKYQERRYTAEILARHWSIALT